MQKRREWLVILAVILAAVVLGVGCAQKPTEPAPAPPPRLGGENVVKLHRDRTGEDLQFLGADILPGRGWNTYQIRAWLPGRGEIEVLSAPTLEEAASLMNGGPEDQSGNKSFTVGGAILVPYANRITGKLSDDGKTIATTVADKSITLPANWGGKQAGARKYAMHGLILDAKIPVTSSTATSAQGDWNGGNFSGHWPSQTELTFKTTLEKNAFDIEVVAKNVGQEPLPMGIGWHPYFRLPSGQREQARLHLPATLRAPANNYDEVLPTGVIEKVAGTKFDFTAPDGVPMGKLFLDDCFTGLVKSGDNTASEIRDPAAAYGIRIIALSPESKAIQVYSPPEKDFIVLEPQFNLADPYNTKVWKKRETGMVLLQPGQSVAYKTRLELFKP